MITKDDVAKIQELKKRGYSQDKVALELKISRSTVARNWGGKRHTFRDLFLLGPCVRCGTVYPKPKFLIQWKCPYCEDDVYWKKPWFSPPERSEGKE